MNKSSIAETCLIVIAALFVGFVAVVALWVYVFVLNAIVVEYVWNLLAPVVIDPNVRLLTFWSAAAVSLFITYLTAPTNTELATKADVKTGSDKEEWYASVIRVILYIGVRSASFVVVAHIIYNNLSA